jgi:hypothetical protein
VRVSAEASKRLHKVMEFLQIPTKRYKVVIDAGQKEITNVSIGTYWYQITQTGKHTISFEPANPLTVRGTVTVRPAGSMSFNMYDFVPSPGHQTFVGGRPLRNPLVQSFLQTWKLVRFADDQTSLDRRFVSQKFLGYVLPMNL